MWLRWINLVREAGRLPRFDEFQILKDERDFETQSTWYKPCKGQYILNFFLRDLCKVDL